MATSAHSVVSTFELGTGAIAFGLTSGMMQQRQARIDRQYAEVAVNAEVAHRARGMALEHVIDDLRERLADSKADADDMREMNAELLAEVAKLRADRQVLAAALQSARA